MPATENIIVIQPWGVVQIYTLCIHFPSTWGPYSVWVHSLVPMLHRDQTVWGYTKINVNKICFDTTILDIM